MAKQKLKLPLDPLAFATEGRPGAVKAKGKVAAKAKSKRGPADPPQARKSKRKGQRAGSSSRAVEAADAPLDLPVMAGQLPPKRARKRRAPAALGSLEKLAYAIDEVRVGGRASPRTRKLLASGVPKMAQKVVEEAAEVAIEAVRGERALLVRETVDLLYNLLVLCSEMQVPLSALWREMDRRELMLGMAEKLPKPPEL